MQDVVANTSGLRTGAARKIRPAALTGLILIAVVVASSSAVHAQDRPNILLIVTDQQSADALSCRMGREYIRTPAMDSLAAHGMVFTHAYAANPLCMPQRNAMFTGRYPHETGVTMNLPSNSRINPAEFVSMGKLFRDAGYETAYFGKWHLCYDRKDIDAHGFETISISPKPDHDAIATRAATRFIARKHDKPFLLVVCFMNPHNVCELARGQDLPDGPIGEAPGPQQCPPVPANLAAQQDEPDTMTMIRKGYHADPRFPVGDFAPDDWRRLRWGYYRLVEKVDGEIGTVLASLRSAGLEDRTVTVFTSDHGECAGAHGFNQKTVLYEESVRVPLIIGHKGRTPAGTCDLLVNTGVDILPTVLEFAGIPVPASLKGRSLHSAACGRSAGPWRDYVVVQNHMDQTAPVGNVRPSAQGRMVRTRRYKYCIYSHGNKRESLVDLQNDPGETRNLAADPDHQDILLRHRELLGAFARENNDTLAAVLIADPTKSVPWQ